jgi:murein DD-endopeptidase MepM/ murein hydrolase activator NlpD
MPNNKKIEKMLAQVSFAKLFDFELNETNCISIDLSDSNKLLLEAKMSNDFDLQQFIFNSIKTKNKIAAIGGYLEKRAIYQMSDVFKNQNQNFRNIHLGVDIWANESTKVYCPLEGKIHSFYDNSTFGDYGPTIITKHQVEGFEFHLLFGHLAKSSLVNLKENDTLSKGQFLCTLGKQSENVGWPPHLHFQIIIDMQNKKGDYFGVCNETEKAFFETNCPNPNFIIKSKLIP